MFSCTSFEVPGDMFTSEKMGIQIWGRGREREREKSGVIPQGTEVHIVSFVGILPCLLSCLGLLSGAQLDHFNAEFQIYELEAVSP